MGKTLPQISFEFSDEEAMNTPVTNKEEPAIKARIIEKKTKPVFADEVNMSNTNTPEKINPVKKSTRGRMSLKEVHINADLINIPPDEVLFQKQYYSIGEVSGWFRVNQSLIRYWETEFDILQPRKNRKGDRFFRPVDVKNLVLIHDLLRRRKFTIEGAKEFLKKNKKAEEKFAMIQSLEKLKAFLNEMKASIG